MNFTRFLLILKARALIAGIALGVTVLTTLVVSLILPKTYTATATLIVDAKSKDPVTGLMQPSQLLPGYLATQVDIINSQNVALKVVKELQLAQSPSVKDDFVKSTGGKGGVELWLADRLLKNLDVEPSRISSIINVSFKGSDPQFSAVLANAFADAYITTNLDLKVAPARQTATWYQTRIKELRNNLDSARARLSAFQTEKGLVATDERLDVETARLAELSSQVVAAQSQTYDIRSRQKESTDTLPDIMNSPVVQGLRAEIARAESKLAELGEKVGRNHPQYQRTATEVATLKAKLESEIKTVTRGVSTSVKVASQREAELRTSLASQKTKLLQLKSERDELAVLLRDVEVAQSTYDTAMLRMNQSSLEAASTQTDVSVLNPAVPPADPSSPRIVLNTVLSFFLGGLLALCVAFIVEMFDRRVRSADDVSSLLGLPVLGELGRNVSQTGFSLRALFGKPTVAKA